MNDTLRDSCPARPDRCPCCGSRAGYRWSVDRTALAALLARWALLAAAGWLAFLALLAVIVVRNLFA